MLTSVVNLKHLTHESSQKKEEETAIATPRTKQTFKAISAQIKDIASKASGVYKNCNSCSGSSNENREWKSEEFKSSNLNPGQWGKEMRVRLKALSSGERTLASGSRRTETVFMEEDEPMEWVAQVEPGVLITFVSFPQRGNDLKQIRFSRESFNKGQAERWWAQNCGKVMELYNVQRLNGQAVPLPTSPRSEDETLKIKSAKNKPATPPLTNEGLLQNFNGPLKVGYSASESLDHHPNQSHNSDEVGGLACINETAIETSSVDSSVRTSEEDQSEELSINNANDTDSEWVEEDEQGVYITIRALPGGTKELRRVCFSREKFGEIHARLWWEENRARIREQYL